jgi:hypothetical protein
VKQAHGRNLGQIDSEREHDARRNGSKGDPLLITFTLQS